MPINRSTRFYSKKQEKQVAKELDGKVVPNSGAIKFGAGDVTLDNWLIECKTCIKEKDSFSIKRKWLIKNKEEALSINKFYNAIAFNYGDGINYYIIDEKTFKTLKNALERELDGKN